MGYRLHASIPNVEYIHNNLELGKQYNERWHEFNDEYFGENADSGMIHPDTFNAFLIDLKRVNREIIENKEMYDLYNIDHLERMFQFASANNYEVYFVSY